MANAMLETLNIKSEPEWNNLIVPEEDQRKYDMQMHPNSTESLDIIETIDSEDNDFAEAESLSLIQFKKDERLCEFYRRMPILYDKAHPHYKFASKKEKAWRELGRLVDMNVEQCKKRMTYFRCRFTVERRVMKNGVCCSEWPLLDKLKFLNKHIKIRRPRAANDPGDADTDDDDHNRSQATQNHRKRSNDDTKDDLHAYLDLQQNHHSQQMHAQSQYQQQQNEIQVQIQQQQQQNRLPPAVHPADSPIPSSNVEVSYTPTPATKRSRMMDMDDNSVSNFNLNRTVKYQNNLEHSINLDEHGAFGLYVGEVLRKLPQNTAAVTSLKIMQVLCEAQINQSRSNSPEENSAHETNGTN